MAFYTIAIEKLILVEISLTMIKFSTKRFFARIKNPGHPKLSTLYTLLIITQSVLPPFPPSKKSYISINVFFLTPYYK